MLFRYYLIKSKKFLKKIFICKKKNNNFSSLSNTIVLSSPGAARKSVFVFAP